VPLGAHPAIVQHFTGATGVGATGKVFDVQGVTTDSAGAIYVVGTFGNAGSTAHFGTHAITSATSTAIFVAKFAPSPTAPAPLTGSWLWATAIDPGSKLSAYQGYGIVIDGLGHVDIVGSLTGPKISPSIVVAQLNSGNGTISWTHVFTGIPGHGSGAGFGITAQPLSSARTVGSLLDITGTIQGTINFAGPVTSAGPSDLFVGQLNEAGTPVWGRALPTPSTASASGRGITYDPAKGVISAVGTLSTPPASALLVAQYTSAGGFLKAATPLGSSPSSEGTGITVDSLNHLYVTGRGRSTPGMYNGAIVAKLDQASLAPLWFHNFVAAGPSRSAEALGVAVDKLGNPFITGAFSGMISFGAGPMPSVAGSLDVFAAKLNPSTGLATPGWSTSGGGKGPDLANGIAFDIATISQVYIVGDYTPPATFGTTALGVNGATNIFLASLQ
jgi:hypothetical protein